MLVKTDLHKAIFPSANAKTLYGLFTKTIKFLLERASLWIVVRPLVKNATICASLLMIVPPGHWRELQTGHLLQHPCQTAVQHTWLPSHLLGGQAVPQVP